METCMRYNGISKTEQLRAKGEVKTSKKTSWRSLHLSQAKFMLSEWLLMEWINDHLVHNHNAGLYEFKPSLPSVFKSRDLCSLSTYTYFWEKICFKFHMKSEEAKNRNTLKDGWVFDWTHNNLFKSLSILIWNTVYVQWCHSQLLYFAFAHLQCFTHIMD